ncbi:tRNA-splicing endonuclease subunit Sen2 [Acipenser ruthenus]|uniref:tRNA-splicing endonuclease subunit Sen2 n=1 Tax=Acipenser ruthenus TaxID=7906 RepID=UPI002740D5A8|nr:tRNA-splicing endonuclease subunit Sen2 [Acipenser ruthenus]XP_058844458.1 tRNA-splicing endonuclease subunit Sen2 [Acipenser ruthenus]
MAEAIFHPPKRRPKVYESYIAPFPVPTSQEEAGLTELRVYRAEIINQHVIVRDPEEIEALYGRGYFGKGLLSRSRPEYRISNKWSDANFMRMPVISSAKYQLHLDWARGVLQGQGLDEDSIEKTLKKYTDPVELECAGSTSRNEQIDCCAAADRGQAEGSTHHSDGDLEPSDSELQSGSPERKKPRRQGDLQYDPLADIYPEEPAVLDKEALSTVKCHKHDDLIMHCGCRLKDSVIDDMLSNATAPPTPSFTPGHEYVLVQEDEENPCDSSEKTPRLVCRINPFRIIEYLQLTLEEAFFLTYALGCLSIYYNEEPLSIVKLWQAFSVIQPSFKTIYMAYHHFRSKGWVPKVGMKYGTDLLLYRKGPPFYHASYSVVVEMVDDTFQGKPLRPFSWRSLAALNRITVNVSKELMFCYVVRPSDMTEEEMSSPECMNRIKVQELIVSRWISSRERTEQEEM